MCGRYVSSRRAAELAAYFSAVDDTDDALAADFNVAPTDWVPAVVAGPSARRLIRLRWGLVPSWSADPRGAARLINARVETVGVRPAFRSALARRRCLLPADGYYEWQREGTGRQPYYLHPADGSVLAFAGLHEVWRAPDGRWLRTCTLLTAEAGDQRGQVHERAPLVVPAGAWDRWLDVRGPAPLDALLPAVPSEQLPVRVTRVSRAVNDVRQDGPELIAPAPAAVAIHPAAAASASAEIGGVSGPEDG